MGKAAVAKAFEDIRAAVAVLNAEAVGRGTAEEVPGSGPGAGRLVDPMGGLADGCLDILAGVPGVEGMVAGLKARAAAAYADTARAVASPGTPAQAMEMAITAEIGCVLTVGDRAAGALLHQAQVLTTVLPLTLAALDAGTFSWQHARVMVEEAATLDAAGAAALEAHFLDPGAPGAATGCPVGEMPASRFRHKARTWRERHHAESIEARHAKGVEDRQVLYTPDRDGMARVEAYLPGDQALAIWNRITATARGLQGPGEDRTLTQLRADTLATALLTHRTTRETTRTPVTSNDTNFPAGREPGLADVPTPRAEVLVTVPVFSLLGLTDEPAMLDGYGPVPASMARDLVANGSGSFYRVLVDPRDGAPLEIGRTSYRLTKAMRQWLRLRDGTCPFPGCSNQSLDNEADHLLAWANGGTTGISNLGNPCRAHHRLRHTTAWKPTPATRTEPPGWISPTGRHYTSEHQDWEPPHLPHQLRSSEGLRGGSSRGQPDFIYTERSLGEDGLEWLLRAPA